MKKRLLICALLAFIGISQVAMISPARAESLGIGITIVPDPTSPTLNSNSNLWFGGEAGKQLQRKVIVTSASTIDQLVVFSLLDLVIVDGEEFVDSQSESDKSSWLKVSPNNFVLAPGSGQEVTLTLTIPEDAEDEASISFLRIQASDAAGFDPNSEDAGTGTKAVLAGAAAVDIETWIGVGDALLLIPKFEFLPPRGIIRDGKKYIRSGFQNRGLVPLLVTGELTLNDQTFAGRTFGPYEYQASGIEENQQGTFEVEVPEEVQEGPWQIYITARMGNVRENRLFTLNLTFVEENTFQPIWIIYILVTAGLSFALVLGVRLIRSGRSERRAVNSVKTISVEQRSLPISEPVEQVEVAIVPQDHSTKRRFDTSTRAKFVMKKPKPSVRGEEYEVQLDDWAEELRRSLREVRADSQALIDKYQVPSPAKEVTSSETRKTGTTKPKASKASSASPSSSKTKAKAKTSTSKRTTAKPKTVKKGNSKPAKGKK